MELRQKWAGVVAEYSLNKSYSTLQKARNLLETIVKSGDKFEPLSRLSKQLVKAIENNLTITVKTICTGKVVDMAVLSIAKDSTQPREGDNLETCCLVKGDIDVGKSVLIKACSPSVTRDALMASVSFPTDNVIEYTVEEEVSQPDAVPTILRKAEDCGMIDNTARKFLAEIGIQFRKALPKSKDTTTRCDVKLFKADATLEEGIIKGVVYSPEDEDLQGDITSEIEIEKAAHGFMIDYLDLNFEHQLPVSKSDAVVVESYLAPVDFVANNTSIKKGSWIITVKLFDEDLKKQYKSGELTGFSFEGMSQLG